MESKKIGWIGTGVMGKSMAEHLMKQGHTLLVYNRTKAKTDELVAAGATYVDKPKDIAAQVDYLFLMVGYPRDVESIVFDAEHGIIGAMKAGSYFIDHTSSSPDLAEKIAAEFKTRGVAALDAPVSGGDVGAKSGKLVVMVGGEADAVEHCRPLMEIYSAKVMNMGGPGKGHQTKMANNMMVASCVFGVCESLVYGHKAGLDLK